MMHLLRHFDHLKLHLEAIKAATNNFAEDNCIGRGGFGKVYKGELVHSKGQSLVAFKRLDPRFGQGNPEFWKEISMLSLYKHENIVSLLGFCDESDEKILVYEYASRRSLDMYLNNKDLSWIQRLKICIGAARGLAFLHNPSGTQQRVLHRDIKSSNILLDENWNAKISDMGLSKFGPANQIYTFLVSNTVGTIGYIDPVYVETGLLTKESDVYSLGVVLFEVLCGRLCISNNDGVHQSLIGLVRRCYAQNKISEIIFESVKDIIKPKSLQMFTEIAYQCLKRDVEDRPLMADVVQKLEKVLDHEIRPKIHVIVGDCALFKPSNDSPPLVGIIRRLDTEDNQNLSVNWLYPPSEVKLSKGSLKAAQNEVFYSFHQDEIPVESLLNPVKVAFLGKGARLPSKEYSFVCRRVYDVQTKRLWWLNDQDYDHELQQVVDQLLDTTRTEMYGGHLPKTFKGKITEQSSDSGQLRSEESLKAELAKITDKGGLVDVEGVEKIIQLMQPESGDKKVDLASRIMLVNVISGTDSSECLGRFVQLRGLLILDEWLQEFHKGKIGDRSPKEGDSVEEFLFALLRALDKLPVNIHALQTCNVGKSVNHLRSHKNPEIIKKAKTLVDTWKKSVEAEMNMIERKRVEQMNIIETRSGTRRAGSGSGSWSNKSMMPEVSPQMVKQVKVSTSQPPVLKPHQGKQSPESPSPTKLSSPATVPVPAGTVSSDVPVVASKQERSSSSSPSGNNSQFSKGSPVTATPERTTDATFSENMNNNNQRLIVRLPNMGRSPARTASGGSVQDHVDGRASEKGETQPDNNVVAMDTESCKEKEGLIGSDDNKGEGASKVADSALKSGKSHEASYSSINALVESCAKFSEVNTSAPAGDDVGMNLLASVAAGEISRSDVSPLSCSPETKPPVLENTRSEDNGNSSHSIEDGCQSEDTLKVSNGQARLVENRNADVGPAPLASDAGTSAKVETHVNDESASRSASDKHEDEKKLEQKEKDDKDSELVTSSSLDQKDKQCEEKANKNPDSSVLLQTIENEAQKVDVSAPPDSKSMPVSETTVKLDFDLNEIDPSDDMEMPVIENRPTSVTVASAAKGPFLSSENLLKTKPELGWKGSAATSAFRPAEPRKPREFLDFDLNVGAVDDNPPSKYLDSRNSGGGGLDLDLNACEESPDVGPLTVNFTRPNSNIPQVPPRSGGFDLNGPGVEETGSESIPVARNGIQFLPNVRMGGNMDVHSWFPQTSTYPQQPQTYPIPQRMSTPMAPALGTSTPFNPELFRGPVLSSSPAVGFSSTTPFQFPGFPFETNFSIPSNPMSTAYVGSSGGPGPGPLCYPTMPSQLMGPLSSTYRPYVMSLPGGSSDNKKWGSHGLDLNSGPGGPDETLLSGLRQLPLADDQLKMFHQMAAGSGGGVLKRKEPVDGWDGDRINYKHPSWQ